MDRIDYLLRDPYHTGTEYGKFDHQRLINTLRILPDVKKGSGRVSLGVELGGIHSAAALLLARHFMTTQVYLHRIRVIYDIHLRDFLLGWLPNSEYSTSIGSILNKWNDVEIMRGIMHPPRRTSALAKDAAQRIVLRKPFHPVYSCSRDSVDFSVGEAIETDLVHKFGEDLVRRMFDDRAPIKIQFPVVSNGKIISSSSVSGTIKSIPKYKFDMIFVDPICEEEAGYVVRRGRLIPKINVNGVANGNRRLVGF